MNSVNRKLPKLASLGFAVFIEIVLIVLLCRATITFGDSYALTVENSPLTVRTAQPIVLHIAFTNRSSQQLELEFDNEGDGAFTASVKNASGVVQAKPAAENPFVATSYIGVEPGSQRNERLNLSRRYFLKPGNYTVEIKPWSPVIAWNTSLLGGNFHGKPGIATVIVTP